VKKILIVDDEVSFLLSLKDGLSVHNDKFQILTAENGREAIDVLRSLSIDLLVTDLKLPEMNGFELLAWTSRHQPQLPVIVMSAFGTPEIEARLAKMDTLQFLEKPLDLEMLEEGIFNGLNAGGKSFIRGITLATFLQLMKVEQKNCTLKVSVSAQSAYLYIQRGELIDAEYGALEGIEAALEIVGWDDAEIEMDGVCRRQNNVINMPMEHLLIDAFKRKDEAEELGKAAQSYLPREIDDLLEPLSPAQPREETKVVNPVDAELQRIAGILTKLVPVQEYAIFDKKSSLRGKSPGNCSLENVDPVVFDHLLNSLGASLGFGDYNYIEFNSINRSHYLLFRDQQYYILAKLRPGSRGQQIVEEIKRNMKQ